VFSFIDLGLPLFSCADSDRMSYWFVLFSRFGSLNSSALQSSIKSQGQGSSSSSGGRVLSPSTASSCSSDLGGDPVLIGHFLHTRVRLLSAEVIYFVKLFSNSVDLLCLGVGTSVLASDLGLPIRIYPVAALLLSNRTLPKAMTCMVFVIINATLPPFLALLALSWGSN